MSESTPEQWRWVVGYEGIYQVSDHGRVYSVPRTTTRGGLLRQFPSGRGGYPEVKLTKNGKQKTCRVHQLVAEAFIGPRPAGMETRHLNDVAHDNRLSNLCYGTSHDNKMDMLRNGGCHWANITHCPKGHEYTEANTYLRTDRTGRECRTCHNEGTMRRMRDLKENGLRCTTKGCHRPQIALGVCRLCYDRQRSAADRSPEWYSRICPHCGETFEKTPGLGQGKRKYCTDECATDARLLRNRTMMAEKRRLNKRGPRSGPL